MFESVLAAMKMGPAEVLFVGNDMYRDIYGAKELGMKTVFFKSNQGTQEKKASSLTILFIISMSC